MVAVGMGNQIDGGFSPGIDVKSVARTHEPFWLQTNEIGHRRVPVRLVVRSSYQPIH
jgi:hypothetical protein